MHHINACISFMHPVLVCTGPPECRARRFMRNPYQWWNLQVLQIPSQWLPLRRSRRQRNWRRCWPKRSLAKRCSQMQSDAVCHSCGFRSPREFFISLCHITQEFKMHGDRKEIGARQKMKRERVLLFFGCCDMLWPAADFDVSPGLLWRWPPNWALAAVVKHARPMAL